MNDALAVVLGMFVCLTPLGVMVGAWFLYRRYTAPRPLRDEPAPKRRSAVESGFSLLHPNSEFEAELTGWVREVQGESCLWTLPSDGEEASVMVTHTPTTDDAPFDGAAALRNVMSKWPEGMTAPLETSVSDSAGCPVFFARGQYGVFQSEAWLFDGREGRTVVLLTKASGESPLSRAFSACIATVRSLAVSPDETVMAAAERELKERIPELTTRRRGRFFLTTSGASTIGWNLKRVLALRASGGDWESALHTEAIEHVVNVQVSTTLLSGVDAPLTEDNALLRLANEELRAYAAKAVCLPLAPGLYEVFVQQSPLHMRIRVPSRDEVERLGFDVHRRAALSRFDRATLDLGPADPRVATVITNRTRVDAAYLAALQPETYAALVPVLGASVLVCLPDQRTLFFAKDDSAHLEVLESFIQHAKAKEVLFAHHVYRVENGRWTLASLVN